VRDADGGRTALGETELPARRRHPVPLKLEDARAIVRRAIDLARAEGSKPLAVAVVDAGGWLVALEREDGSANARPDLAIAKARTALALGLSSQSVAALFDERPELFAAIDRAAGGGLLPLPGGLPIVSSDGERLGAIGVSGGELAAETALAGKAIENCGFSLGAKGAS